MKRSIPPWLDWKLMDSIAGLCERETTEDDKFLYLKEREIAKLIRPSIDEKFFKNRTRKLYKKRLNALLRNTAILTLNKSGFIEDVISFARSNALGGMAYKINPDDFYALQSSPTLNAWDCRLKYLSAVFLRKRIGNKKDYDIKELFIDTYLPPKFERKVIALMDKYGLQFFWYESFVNLLLTGIWYLPRNASVVHVNLSDLSEDSLRVGHATLSLDIYSLTSIEEIKYRWAEIESLKKEIFPTLKSRVRPKDLDEVFISKFKSELLQLAESKRTNKSLKDHKRKLASAKREINRAEADHQDFLQNYKRIPQRILREIYVLDEWSIQSRYYF